MAPVFCFGLMEGQNGSHFEKPKRPYGAKTALFFLLCAQSKESEIYKHINSCEHFLYYSTLFNFPHTLFNLDDFTSESIILNNCKILDKSRHWSLLLFKESLYICQQRPELNHRYKASKELMIFN